jgi:hypothetical protein
MKPDAPAEVRGPFRPTASSVPVVPVCEHLPSVSRELRRFTQVRSVVHDDVILNTLGVSPKQVVRDKAGKPMDLSEGEVIRGLGSGRREGTSGTAYHLLVSCGF